MLCWDAVALSRPGLSGMHLNGDAPIGSHHSEWCGVGGSGGESDRRHFPDWELRQEVIREKDAGGKRSGNSAGN